MLGLLFNNLNPVYSKKELTINMNIQKLEYYNIITVPGLNGSGADHWHTHWEREFPSLKRVEQEDWDHPDMQTWVDRLEKTLLMYQDKPIILIGHSLGCGTIVHAVNQGKVKGVTAAFLVAMPDIDREDFPKECVGFSPVPKLELPFYSVMIGSEDDPYISIDVLKDWAKILRCEFINVGLRGHIGTAANLGEWEEGQLLFDSFLDKVNAR